MTRKNYLFFFNIPKSKKIEEKKIEINEQPIIITSIQRQCNVCWWCDCLIKNNPIHIPYKEMIGCNAPGILIAESKTLTYECYGFFDTYQCAYAYNNHFGIHKDQSDTLIKYMYHMDYNDTFEIQEAPQKIIMAKYGGIFSEEQYHEMLDENYLHKFTLCLKPFVVNNVDVMILKIPK